MKILRFSIRSAMDGYEAKTGIHLSYESLSALSGVSSNTLKSIASRIDYNVTFQTVTQICNALNVNPLDHMEWIDAPE
mgnify:CR=1 FL=1